MTVTTGARSRVADIPIPLVGPSNEGISRKADCQRTINLYPAKIEREGEKARWHLQSCPGLSEFCDVVYTKIRGVYEFEGRPFVCAREQIIEIYENGAQRVFVGLGTVRGRVCFADLNDLFVVGDGTGFFAINLTSLTIGAVANVPAGRFCRQFNQRMLYLERGSGRIYFSDLNDPLTVDPPSFFTAENQPDDAVTFHVTEDQIWIFGTKTIEVWYNSGDADNPFERVPGGVIHTGVLSEDTVARVDNSFFFVEQSEHGKGIVRRTNGFTPVRVSTAAVERFTESATNLSAYTYGEQGRLFYVLNADEGTWVYDLKDQEWHERAFLNVNTGELERGRPEHHVFAFGKHLVTDYESGKVYEQSLSHFDHAGTPMVRRRVTGGIRLSDRAVTVDEVSIGVSTGVGLTVGQGSDPKLMFRYSRDGGNVWSNELSRTIGRIGEYDTRVKINSLGLGFDWAFEISVSDPVPLVFVDAEARVRVGRR